MGEISPTLEPSLKAVDLSDLTDWAYRRQRVLEMGDVSLFAIEAEADGRELQGRSACGCAVIERLGAIGTHVDGGGFRGSSGRVHPDAEAVHAIVAQLSPMERGAIVRYARDGGPPPHLDPESVRLVRVPVPEGTRGPVRHQVLGAWEFQPYAEVQEQRRRYDATDTKRNGKFPTIQKGFSYRAPVSAGAAASRCDREVLRRWCPVQMRPSPDQVARVNRSYAIWHAAMSRLCELLAAVPFREHRVLGFRAPAQPWGASPPRSPALESAIASYRALEPVP